jgi:hypothetical protein
MGGFRVGRSGFEGASASIDAPLAVAPKEPSFLYQPRAKRLEPFKATSKAVVAEDPHLGAGGLSNPYESFAELVGTSRPGGRSPSIRAGSLTLATRPPVPSSRTRMDPRGRQRKMGAFFIARLESTYSWPGSGLDAYLRCFGEGFA